MIPVGAAAHVQAFHITLATITSCDKHTGSGLLSTGNLTALRENEDNLISGSQHSFLVALRSRVCPFPISELPFNLPYNHRLNTTAIMKTVT